MPAGRDLTLAIETSNPSAGGGGPGIALGRASPSGADLLGVELLRDTARHDDDLMPAIDRLSFSRSGGPGGQNVNKVASKAELRLPIRDLPISERALHRLARLAGRRLTDEGELIIISESERSQARNRAECFDKLRELLVAAMAEPKVRRKSKPGRGAVDRRLREKKSRAEIKRRRAGPPE